MIDNIIVGRTISVLRQNRGLTQQQLAASLSVSHQAVSKWEKGAALPDIQTMIALTRFFGITVEQLVNGEIPEEKEAEKPRTLDEHIQNIGSFVNSVVEGIFHPMKNDPMDAEYEDISEAPVEKPESESENNIRNAGAETNAHREEKPFDIQKLLQMAPYMSKQTVDELLLENRDKLTAADIAKFAPYVSRECLEKLIEGSDHDFSWEVLQRIAPFLKREMVDGLARAAAKGERFVKRAVSQSCKATEDFEKTLEDVSQKIGRGVDKVFRKAAKFGEEVAEGVSAVFEDLSENGKSSRNRAQMLRNAAFERALQDERWDWISEHLKELSDDEIRGKIACKAAALGMNDWLMDYMPGFISANIIDDAMAEGKWEWLGEHIYDFEEDMITRILLGAADAGKWSWILENSLETVGADCSAELIRKSYDAGELELTMKILENNPDETVRSGLANYVLGKGDLCFLKKISHLLERGYLGQICIAWAQQKEWGNVAEFAALADNACIEAMMELAIAEGNFDAIDILNDYLV